MAICFDLSLQNSKAIIHKLCNASRGRGLALMLCYGKDGEINALFGIAEVGQVLVTMVLHNL